MRRRLMFLFVLCALLMIVRSLPADVLPVSAEPSLLIIADLSSMQLSLYEQGERVGRWPIAVGAGDSPTPLGIFHVTRRFVPREKSIFGTRFLGLDVPWGVYGIHGTNQPGSIGRHASAGCIRMFTRDVEKLYDMVTVGTPVIIEEGPYGAFGWSLKKLEPGTRGSQVLEAQKRLRQLGYYAGSLDGMYNPGLSNALIRFKMDQGMGEEDVIDSATWQAMGVVLFD